jgi:hypothetical protein
MHSNRPSPYLEQRRETTGKELVGSLVHAPSCGRGWGVISLRGMTEHSPGLVTFNVDTVSKIDRRHPYHSSPEILFVNSKQFAYKESKPTYILAINSYHVLRTATSFSRFTTGTAVPGSD